MSATNIADDVLGSSEQYQSGADWVGTAVVFLMQVHDYASAHTDLGCVIVIGHITLQRLFVDVCILGGPARRRAEFGGRVGVSLCGALEPVVGLLQVSIAPPRFPRPQLHGQQLRAQVVAAVPQRCVSTTRFFPARILPSPIFGSFPCSLVLGVTEEPPHTS